MSKVLIVEDDPIMADSFEDDLVDAGSESDGLRVDPFTVQPLVPEQLRVVYPLVREVLPELKLADWLRFGRHLTKHRQGGQRGILAAYRKGRVFPTGLVCYQVDDDLERGRVLIAKDFCAMDLLDPKLVLAVLVAALEALGLRLGCNAVRCVVRADSSQIAGGLSAAGHAPEGLLLMKPLVPELSGTEYSAERADAHPTVQQPPSREQCQRAALSGKTIARLQRAVT
jgi:hypothetical protein